MRAAVLDEYGKPLELRQVDTPEPGPGEVLVRIGGSGACHSDLHVLDADMPMVPSLPWILGHENAGWVEALGAGASGFEVGEPVAVYGGWGCGHCRFCASGDEQVCNVMRWSGIGRPGGYAEYMVVPSTRHLMPLGDLDPAQAAPLTDAGLTPYRAVKRSLPYLPPGSAAVVIGVGGLGHYGLQFLKLLSPATVVAVDTAADKLQFATDLGADATLDPAEVDVVEEVKSMTGGEGAQAVLDFVGVEATLAYAAGSAGRQGLVSVMGLGGGTLPFSFMAIASEAAVIGSAWGSRNELAEVIALARRGELADTTETYPLEEINGVFDKLRAGEVRGRAVLVP